MIFLEYQNIDTFLQNSMLYIGLKKFLLLQKLKTLCLAVINILGNILSRKSYCYVLQKKKKKKKNQKELKVEKVLKRKCDKLFNVKS